jgi:hypothetical protein
MIPPPSHLATCTRPVRQLAEEHQYAGHIRCTCGGEIFELLHTGQTHEWNGETIPCVAEIDGEFFFRLAARCAACETEHLLLDQDFHGWNGFVCRNESDQRRPRPSLVVWECLLCGDTHHSADVVISSEGMDSAIEESTGVLDESNWQEGFGWIDIHIRCNACGAQKISWVSCETM